jgi:hypothetical protein
MMKYTPQNTILGATQLGRAGNFSDISVMRAVYTACLPLVVVFPNLRCAYEDRSLSKKIQEPFRGVK